MKTFKKIKRFLFKIAMKVVDFLLERITDQKKIYDFYFIAGYNSHEPEYKRRAFKQYSPRLIEHFKKIENYRSQRSVIKILAKLREKCLIKKRMSNKVLEVES